MRCQITTTTPQTPEQEPKHRNNLMSKSAIESANLANATFKEIIASAIRAERARRGLRQEDVAQQAGLPSYSVGRIEGGKHNVTIDTIEKVCRVLGLQLNLCLQSTNQPSTSKPETAMANTYFKSKKSETIYLVKVLDNGEIWMSIDGVNPIFGAGQIIAAKGGKEAFLSQCFTDERSIDELNKEQIKEHFAKQKQAKASAEIRMAALRVETEAALKRLQGAATDGVIPATVENVKIIAEYLNCRSWGSWTLPAMSIPYTANQYDCGGKMATTIILDEPIDGEVKFIYGAPVTHLAKYRHI